MACLRSVLHYRCGYFGSLRVRLSKTPCAFIQRDFGTSDQVVYHHVDNADITNSQTDAVKDSLSTNKSNDFQKEARYKQLKSLIGTDCFNEFVAIKNYSQLWELLKEKPVHFSKPYLVFNKLIYISRKCSSSSPDLEEKDSFLKSDEFKILCVSLEQHLPTMQPRALYKILENSHILNIPVSSLLIQKVLTLILDNINKYSIIDKLSILCIVSKEEYNETPVVKAIKLTCLSSLNLSLESSEFIRNREELNSVAYFSDKKVLPFKIRKILLTEIFKNNLEELSPSAIYFLFSALSKQKLEDLPKEKLITAFKNKVKKNEMSNALAFRTGLRYVVSVLKGYWSYSESFSDSLSMLFVNKEADLEMATNLLRFSCEMGHLNFILLTYVLGKVQLTSLETLPQGVVKHLSYIFSSTCFNESGGEDWAVFKNYFENADIKWDGWPLLEWAADCVSLGIQNNRLGEAFSEVAALYQSIKKQNPVVRFSYLWDILLLHHYANIFYSNIAKEIPTEILLDCFERLAQNSLSFECEQTIEEIFGGEEYVFKLCKTSQWHLLSYAILLGPDNKPIDVSPYKVRYFKNGYYNIDEIQEISLQGRLLIIQEFSHDAICTNFRNVPLMTGRTKLFLNLLEALGLDAICINKHQFMQLLESERKPYILSKIEAKVGKISLNDQDKC